MKTFVDESGGFSWTNAGRSTFAALSLPDQALPELYIDFLRWKRDFLGLKRQKEIKGSQLKTKQLISFVERVVAPHPNFRLTFVAVDTKLTSASVVDAIRNQWADIVAVVASRYS